MYVRPATLYSTLGWFDDPLPRNLLAWREEDLIDVAVHEQVHATVYVPSDVTYDESLASFIAHQATLAQLADRPELAARARDAFADELTYATLVNALARGARGRLRRVERAGRRARAARADLRALPAGGVSGAALAHAALRALPDARALERVAGREPQLPGAPALLRARARGARRRPARRSCARTATRRATARPTARPRREPRVRVPGPRRHADRGPRLRASSCPTTRRSPGAYEAVRALRAAGFGTAIVTNQSGIARGRFGEADFARFQAHLAGGLRRARRGARRRPTTARTCPTPAASAASRGRVCCCARSASSAPTSRASWVIGDKESDVGLARAAGCAAVLLGPAGAPRADGVALAPDVLAAARLVLAEPR